MTVTVIDINNKEHKVKTETMDILEDSIVFKDLVERVVAVFMRDKIIGFRVEN